MSAEIGPERHPRDRLKPELGLVDATLLVVSGVIGSGIFLTPGGIADLLPHPGAILPAWLAGGLPPPPRALPDPKPGASVPPGGRHYRHPLHALHPAAGLLVR